jgi:hypothetical protein
MGGAEFWHRQMFSVPPITKRIAKKNVGRLWRLASNWLEKWRLIIRYSLFLQSSAKQFKSAQKTDGNGRLLSGRRGSRRLTH